LRAPVIERDERTGNPQSPRKSEGKGTPQGGVISPFRANVLRAIIHASGVARSKAQSVEIVLRNVKEITPQSVCTVLHPGEKAAVPVTVRLDGQTIRLTVPLQRGCGMVRFENKDAATNSTHN